jgi:hypothetical protein
MQEEDRIIVQEVAVLKNKLGDRTLTGVSAEQQVHYCALRQAYGVAEALEGVSCTHHLRGDVGPRRQFRLHEDGRGMSRVPTPPVCAYTCFPVPLQLSASSNLLEKRVAYLCAGLTFSPEHEFRMMLVNRLQRDLAVTYTRLHAVVLMFQLDC